MKDNSPVSPLPAPRRRSTAGDLLCAGTFLLLVCVFNVGYLLPAYGYATDNQSELKTIQQGIVEKEKHVRQQQQQRGTLLTQLQTQEKVIAQASRQLRETQITLANSNKTIAALTASISQLEKQQSVQEIRLANQLDAAFRQGKQSSLQLIFNGEQSQRNARILAYFGYLNEAREKTIDDLKKTRHTLALKQAALTDKQAKQKNLLLQRQSQQLKLEGARQVRKKTLGALETSLAENQTQLAEMRENETRLRAKIAKAEQEARAQAQQEAREAQRVHERQRQAKSKGKIYKPTASERSLTSRTGGLGKAASQALWPVRGNLLHRFGEPLQGELSWKGLVIRAAEGTEVRSIADGRVLMADWLDGYGLVVVIEHGKGDMSLYGYNQSALVSVGTQVKAGQPIALVGTSGGQGSPSLYFEIRRQGQAVNPLPWLGK